jgi:hypothetical protein
MGDRKAAQHGVSKRVAAQLAGSRKHPTHAQRGADDFRVTSAVDARSHDLLEGDDVGVDGAKDGGDAIRPRPPIEAPTAMDVVSDDAERRRRAMTHYAMIVVAVRALLAALGVVLCATACSTPPKDPLQLDRNILTVDNRTSADWAHVEIWLNTYYRVTTPSIPANSRFQAPLDTFVAGFGQRFDFRRTQVKDLRLTATLPDGKPLELKKQFEEAGLGAVVGGRK